jgi:hypothetical protein
MDRAGAIQVLVKQIRLQAQDFGWDISVDRDELRRHSYRSAQVAADFKIRSVSYAIDEDLDGDIQAFFVADRFAVIVGHLGQDPNRCDGRFRQFHRRAAIIRSWLPDVQKDDVYLFLIAPADPRPLWIDRARLIERDELICRKLVWLAPTELQEQEASARRFCDRTFLARPWSVAKGNVSQKLDFRSDLPSAWMKALTGDTGPGAELVEQLLRTFKQQR